MCRHHETCHISWRKKSPELEHTPNVELTFKTYPLDIWYVHSNLEPPTCPLVSGMAMHWNYSLSAVGSVWVCCKGCRGQPENPCKMKDASITGTSIIISYMGTVTYQCVLNCSHFNVLYNYVFSAEPEVIWTRLSRSSIFTAHKKLFWWRLAKWENTINP
jgi:hypothetical protein